MLKTLRISNYAIINEAEIQFSSALNIITGETGAGKSILLGALNLLLGERADTKVLYSKEKKCIVEGVFVIGGYNLQHFFEVANIDYANETLIRREITDAGKSRAFINDTPVSLNVLQQLSHQLVTIHSQHETLELGNSAFQLITVDALAGTEKILESYKTDFLQWKNISKNLTEAEAAAGKALAEKDFLEFQVQELRAARIDELDVPQLENELQQLTHAEEIKRSISTAVQLLANSENNILDTLRTAVHPLQSVVNFSTGLQEYIERIQSAVIDLKDVSRDLETKAEMVQADPQRAEEINRIVSAVYRLQKKHNCKTTQELLDLKNTFEETLRKFSSNEETIELLKKEQQKLYHSLLSKAKKLSDKRVQIFSTLEKQVQKLLAEVGMKDATFSVQHIFDTEQNLSATGADVVRFLFSANKGSELRDIKQVASGGELSRLMLCIKSLLAQSTALPTLIFDEIDSGVSGEIAHKVGKILSRLAQKHQVISITHLPQIASKGNHHLYVYKIAGKNITQTHIKLLNSEERLNEIAKMLSGEKPGASALNNARELLAAEAID